MAGTRLNLLDELYLHLDRRQEPWVVHVEVRAAERLDAERLARALATAVQRHPIARARLAPWRPTDSGYHWEILDGLSEVPIRIADCADEAELAEARERHFSFSPSLEVAPPFAVLLAHVPAGDAVVLNLHHAAADGIGALRLMQSVLRAYAGRDDPVPTLDPLAVRDVGALAAARSPAERRRRGRAMVRDAALRAVPAARVAREGGSERPAYGFELAALSVDETAAVRRRRTPRTTVNDVLLAALAVTIARWNAQHGRGAPRIALTMPVNLRPRAWEHEVVANFASFVTVSVPAGERRDLDDALAAVGRRTVVIKQHALGGTVVDVLEAMALLSVGVKRRLPELIPRSGGTVVDTASLSNLGIVDDPPALGNDDGARPGMWFSQPGRMPLGTCIGALTVNDRLHLTLRYSHAQFDRRGARAFFDLYREVLLSAPAAPRAG